MRWHSGKIQYWLSISTMNWVDWWINRTTESQSDCIDQRFQNGYNKSWKWCRYNPKFLSFLKTYDREILNMSNNCSKVFFSYGKDFQNQKFHLYENFKIFCNNILRSSFFQDLTPRSPLISRPVKSIRSVCFDCNRKIYVI